MQTDFSRFTPKAKRVLTVSEALSVRCSYSRIEPQVMMVSLVQEDRDMVFFLLQKMGVDRNAFCQSVSESLRSLPRSSGATPSASQGLERVLEKAVSLAGESGSGVVAVEHLFWSLGVTPGPVRDLMLRFGITERRLRDAVAAFRNGNMDCSDARTDAGCESSGALQFLNKYARNLVKLAQEGKIEPAIGRDDEVRRILQILSRKTKNNPLLVGEPGTGKTAIVEGLAHRIVRGDVPRELTGLKIFSLDFSALIAGTSQHGEFEQRLKKVIEEAKNDPKIVIFIDEIHLLIGSGGSLDAANILKPEMARGEIKLIGATTTEEYTKYIETDKAFERRFQRVSVEEPDEDEAITILRGIKPRFETFHRIKILDGALVSAVKLSRRYLSGRYLPDKAIDLVDEAAARMRIERSSVPSELDDLSAQIRSKEMERESLRQDEEPHDLSELNSEIASLREKENGLNARWSNERAQMEELQSKREALEALKADFEQAERAGQYESAVTLRGRMTALEGEIDSLLSEASRSSSPLLKTSLDEDDIREVIQSLTGIPVSRLDEDESEKLLGMEDRLKGSVVGQDEAVSSVSKVVRRNRMGFGDAGRPIGSFLFLGTTGVGKTELAKVLAECLFNSRDALVRIDMSEYQQEYSVSRLFGAPPGYVGYDRGGQLTEAVRRKPYSVILLDEIEKAHPKVFETLLQLLDDGRMTDGQGRVVDFKNTIVIMTSNLCAAQISEVLSAASPSDEDIARAKALVMERMKEKVAPEFLNRIDDIVMFRPLGLRQIEKIVEIQLAALVEKMTGRGLRLSFDPSAVSLITLRGYAPEYGARPVKRTINDLVVNELTLKLLSGQLDPGREIRLSSADGESLQIVNVEEDRGIFSPEWSI